MDENYEYNLNRGGMFWYGELKKGRKRGEDRQKDRDDGGGGSSEGGSGEYVVKTNFLFPWTKFSLYHQTLRKKSVPCSTVICNDYREITKVDTW